MAAESHEESAPVRRVSDLIEIFRAAEKPTREFLLGTEAEKFGVHAETFAPLSYDGEFGVVHVLQALRRFGWEPEAETHDGPLIALKRGPSSVTLEPGSQLELSGAALPDVHRVRAELDQHFAELAQLSGELKVIWLSVGFHPLAAQNELTWVPKKRYAIMREYLPPLGAAALDMMRRTATVQVNLDYENETDAMRKLRVALLLSPLLNAICANSPVRERRQSGVKSLRGQVWLDMDRSRSGLVRRVLDLPRATYADYVEWALDAGMFLFKRGERVFPNTGQTFREFMADGFEGERATLADFKLHLNTLFPEVRLKNTLELRSCDALPGSLLTALPALGAGIFYDETALAEAEVLAETIGPNSAEEARPELVKLGLGATIGGVPARELAVRLLEVAAAGLDRRARLDPTGLSERKYIEPLLGLAAKGQSPADLLRDGLPSDGPIPASELVARTRIF